MNGGAIITHGGLTVTNQAQQRKRTVVLIAPYTIKGKIETGKEVEGIFRLTTGRKIGFNGVIGEIKKDSITVTVRGDYYEDFSKTIKKVERWQLLTEK